MNEEESLLTSEVIRYIESGLGEDNYLSKPERMARKIMVELVKAGRAEFLLLRDDEVNGWWGSIVGSIREKILKYKERVRVYEVKKQAYDKLTAQERRTLGIRKPVKPKGYDKA